MPELSLSIRLVSSGAVSTEDFVRAVAFFNASTALIAALTAAPGLQNGEEIINVSPCDCRLEPGTRQAILIESLCHLGLPLRQLPTFIVPSYFGLSAALVVNAANAADAATVRSILKLPQ